MSNNHKRFKVGVCTSLADDQYLEFRRFKMAIDDCNLLRLQEMLKKIFNNQSFHIFWNDYVIDDPEG